MLTDIHVSQILTASEHQEAVVAFLESLGFRTLQTDSSFSIHTLLGERLD